MSDQLPGFDSKFKALGGFSAPTQKGCKLRRVIKGLLDLYTGKMAIVVLSTYRETTTTYLYL